MEFIESLYNSKYFMLGLSILIVVLVILFLVILLSGKKKTKKVVPEEASKEESLMNTMSFSAPIEETVEPASSQPIVENNIGIDDKAPVLDEKFGLEEEKVPFNEPIIDDNLAFPGDAVSFKENPIEEIHKTIDFEPFPTFNEPKEEPVMDEMPSLKREPEQFSSVYVEDTLPKISSTEEELPKSKVEERISFVVEDELPKLNDENKM